MKSYGRIEKMIFLKIKEPQNAAISRSQTTSNLIHLFIVRFATVTWRFWEFAKKTSCKIIHNCFV